MLNKKPNPSVSPFAQAVSEHVASVPHGHTTTYKAVARAVGHPRAARAVARVLAANYDPSVPCHRVVRSDGSVSGYNRGGPVVKAAMLQAERDAGV